MGVKSRPLRFVTPRALDAIRSQRADITQRYSNYMATFITRVGVN